jgi:EF hand domain-containing protein
VLLAVCEVAWRSADVPRHPSSTNQATLGSLSRRVPFCAFVCVAYLNRSFATLMEMKATSAFFNTFSSGSLTARLRRCCEFGAAIRDFTREISMNTSKLSILAIALAAAAFTGACNRADKSADTAYNNEPAATANPPTTDTAAQPATTDTTGTNTAATDTTSATEPTATPISPTPTTSPTTDTTTTTANAVTSFDDMDTNNDGALSRDELSDTSALRQNFSTADKDGNGTLSRAEVEAQRGTMPPPGG